MRQWCKNIAITYGKIDDRLVTLDIFMGFFQSPIEFESSFRKVSGWT
jgi:hypothetical protein